MMSKIVNEINISINLSARYSVQRINNITTTAKTSLCFMMFYNVYHNPPKSGILCVNFILNFQRNIF